MTIDENFHSPEIHLEYWRKLFREKIKDLEISAHRSKVHTLHWNCTGSLLATGSTDTTIRIWPLANLLRAGGEIPSSSSIEIKGHEGGVDQLAWSPTDPLLLASVAADRTCRFWQVDEIKKTFRLVETVNLASDHINLAWSPHGDRLAISSKDDQLCLLEVPPLSSWCRPTMGKPRKFAHEVNELAWSPDARQLFVTRGNGSLECLSTDTLETQIIHHAHPSNCYCIRFDPEGKNLVVGSADALISYWRWPSMECIRTFGRLDWPIRALAFSGDGRMIVAASEDSFLDVSWVNGGQAVARILVPAAVNAVAWHPKQLIIAYAAEQTDGRTGRPTGTFHICAAI